MLVDRRFNCVGAAVFDAKVHSYVRVSPLSCHRHVLQLSAISCSSISHCGRTALLVKLHLSVQSMSCPSQEPYQSSRGWATGCMAECSAPGPRSSGSIGVTEIKLQVHELVSEISPGTLHCHCNGFHSSVMGSETPLRSSGLYTHQ